METRIELRQAVLGPPSLMSIPCAPRRFGWIKDGLRLKDIGKDEPDKEGMCVDTSLESVCLEGPTLF